jgi:hypothetical protein
MTTYGFTTKELRSLRRLRTPVLIQRFLDSLPYHHGSTAWSPRRTLREGTAHCLEGAILAAAALRVNGFPPLLIDLEAVQDVDHVLAVYRIHNHWGAIGKSNYAGLRYREPVYRSLRELAMSYFDQYYNLRGERTLRAYSRPLNLRRFDGRHWMICEKDVWFIPEHFCHVAHTSLLTERQARNLSRLDPRSKAAGLVGHAKQA